jgi:hypothetical protein
MAKKIQIRRGNATDWTNFNPVLSSGEIGYDTTNKSFKVGDGTTLWNSLAYTFITPTTLTTILGDYPTETELTTALGNYVTETDLTTELGNYVTETALGTELEDYVTESALSTTLEDYATTAEVGGLLSAADAMIFKGTIGTEGTITTLPTTYSAGWAYKVITAGTFAGEVCEVGDLIIAIVDRAGTGNTNDDWTVVQTNLDGVVIGPTSATDGNIPVYNGTSGKSIGTGYGVQTTLSSSTTEIPRADAVHTAIGTVSTALGTLETTVGTKATTVTYTGTIGAGSWSGSGPFTKAITVTGILETDNPIIDLDLSGVAFADVAARQAEWGKIYRAVTSTNTITFSSTVALTLAFPFTAKVVR